MCLYPVRGGEHRDHPGSAGQAAPCWGSTQGWLPLTQSCPFLGASVFAHALRGLSQPLAGPPQGTTGLELQLKPLILIYFFLYFH